MLVSVFGIRGHSELWHEPFWLTLKTPVMMVLDHSHVPAVVLVVEDEIAAHARRRYRGGRRLCIGRGLGCPTKLSQSSSRDSDIALLFTDIQMPCSMDGLGLAHAVR